MNIPIDALRGCPAERPFLDHKSTGITQHTMHPQPESFFPHKYEDTTKGLVFCVLCGHVLRESLQK